MIPEEKKNLQLQKRKKKIYNSRREKKKIYNSRREKKKFTIPEEKKKNLQFRISENFLRKKIMNFEIKSQDSQK